MVVFRASIRTVTGSETKHGGKKTRGSAEEIREQIDSDTGGRKAGEEAWKGHTICPVVLIMSA